MAYGNVGRKPIARGFFGFRCDFLGQSFGIVKKVSGGQVVGELGTHQCGPGNLQIKQVNNVKVNEITVEIGMAQAEGLYTWINDSLVNNSKTYSGAIAYFDLDRQMAWERTYYDAYVTEITVPALGGDASDSPYMTVKLQPRTVEEKCGTGRFEGELVSEEQQKRWSNANFQVEMGGIGQGAGKVESFSWKQTVTQDKTGDTWLGHEQCPTKLELTNVKVSMGLQHRQDWNEWYEDFVMRGNCGSGNHRQGWLRYITSTGDKLADINLIDCGVLSLDDGTAEANADGIAKFDAEIYLQDMRFEFAAGAKGA